MVRPEGQDLHVQEKRSGVIDIRPVFRFWPSREGRPAGSVRASGFPFPPLKFRTAGFPQYGFKWTVNSDLRRHPEAYYHGK